MSLNTSVLQHTILLLETALVRYREEDPESLEVEILRHAILKEYELIQELAHGLIRKALREFVPGIPRLHATPVKELLRLAARYDLLTLDEVERWFAYRDQRNATAHEYGERLVLEAMERLVDFVRDSRNLALRLEEMSRR
ncbi:MAG: nucleotidyltransferase substrate binding protein [Magnetococcales bacterium]|nr:nucleotidyltransferase substrate binding protein [Magnetococcales bacterium]